MFNLYGFNTANGGVKSVVPNSAMMESMVWNPKDNNFWGFGVNATGTGLRTLVSFNSQSGFTYKSGLPQFWIIDSDVATLNIATQTMYAILSPAGNDNVYDLVGVNLQTGKAVTYPRFTANLWTLNYLN